jgi:hypothetical protein
MSEFAHMHVVGTALLIRFIFQRYIYILILKKTYLEVISEHPLLAVVSKGELRCILV